MKTFFLLMFMFVTACGPAFHSDLFGGEQDAATMVPTDVHSDATEADVTATDAAQPYRDAFAGDEAQVGDAAAPDTTDATTIDAPVEACSCDELCSGAYPLRACESCYREACPTWEGGLPQ